MSCLRVMVEATGHSDVLRDECMLAAQCLDSSVCSVSRKTAFAQEVLFIQKLDDNDLMKECEEAHQDERPQDGRVSSLKAARAASDVSL